MDLQILQWVHSNLHGSNFINHVVKYITYLGEAGWFWIALGFVLLCFKKTRRGVLPYFIALAINILIVNVILKNAVARPRPWTKDGAFLEFITGLGMDKPSEHSFPSGHSAISFVSATALTLIYGKKWAYSFILASLIALSRIFLCVHYPTDVLAGMVVGAGVAFGAYYAYMAIVKKIKNKKQREKN